MKKSKLLIHEETLVNKIHFIRGQKVMIDRDLAELYGVETKVLKQAVKRNMERFPADFMFRMNKDEFKNWRSQIVTSNSDKMGLRHLPFVFTEQGVAMLSSVLKSKQAIAVNIQIIRVFIKMRQLLLANKDILLKLEKLESQMQKYDEDSKKHDEQIQLIFQYLKKLFNTNIRLPPPKRVIGYKLKRDK